MPPTDGVSTGEEAAGASRAAAPAVILVDPQLPENIGATARAMLNFGLTDLRLVRPHKAFPNPRATALASGADRVLDAARVFDTTAAAVADLHRLYATTARNRDMLKPIVTPAAAAEDAVAAAGRGERVGILFGGERVGLLTEDVVLAEAILSIPANPDYSSLNLAQAVLIVAYEWRQRALAPAARRFDMGRTRPATREEVHGLFDHLTRELDESGYFDRNLDKRQAMLDNIRNSLQRGPLLDQDVRTLRGVIKQLAGKRIPGSKINKNKGRDA